MPDVTSLIVLGLGSLLVVTAFVVARAAARLRRGSGLPGGKVVGTDTGQVRGKPLFSARYGLTGTPDYLVVTEEGIVPVEVKPTRTEEEPRPNHLLQVLAYCLLVEESEGTKPPYGLLRYKTASFRVDYNEGTRAYLLDVMEKMREEAEKEEWQVERNHESAGRCRACGYRERCSLSLWRVEER